MNKKILIVEDESSYQKILKEKLLSKSFEVILASDGLSAFELARKNQPDLILADLKLPYISGIELIKKIRTELGDWGVNAKIIILTTSDDAENISSAVEMGVYEYFIKNDTRIEELIENIENKLK